MDKHDDVNNPKHYDLFPDQQVIDVIKSALTPEEFSGYCKGNALKYRLRAGDKGDALKCIAKANWYQNRLRTQDQIKKTCAAPKPWPDGAEVEWPDESRIDVIGQNGNDGAVYSEYTLDEVIGDAVLSDWAEWVVVDGYGTVVELSVKPVAGESAWLVSCDYFVSANINKVAPPLNFKNCLFKVKK